MYSPRLPKPRHWQYWQTISCHPSFNNTECINHNVDKKCADEAVSVARLVPACQCQGQPEAVDAMMTRPSMATLSVESGPAHNRAHWQHRDRPGRGRQPLRNPMLARATVQVSSALDIIDDHLQFFFLSSASHESGFTSTSHGTCPVTGHVLVHPGPSTNLKLTSSHVLTHGGAPSCEPLLRNSRPSPSAAG